MLFRGNHENYSNMKNKSISLPGIITTSRSLAPRSCGNGPLGRAASCISWMHFNISQAVKKGSLTVEAAFALPLFFLTVVALIGLMRIYGYFAVEMVSLQQKAEREAGSLIYSMSESSVPIIKRGKVQGELPCLPFDASALNIRVAAKVLPWTGRDDYTDLASDGSSDGKLYYVSDYQSVYHTDSGCSYLSLQITAAEGKNIRGMKNREGDHYGACELCIGAGQTGSVVYVTENGEHYHNSPECSGLKRSVHLVDGSEVEGLHECSRCSKKEQTS